MKKFINDLKKMRSFLLLWFTQLISGLGSAMTSYALVDQVFEPVMKAQGADSILDECKYSNNGLN